jgi:hypothetical protein
MDLVIPDASKALSVGTKTVKNDEDNVPVVLNKESRCVLVIA